MEKFIELLRDLQRDVTALRSDIRVLTEKVDRLSVGTENVVVPPMTPPQENTYGNYGRQLSPSERAYLDQLHQKKSHIPAPQSPPTTAEVVPASPQTAAATRYVPSEPNVVERFISWVAKDWPMKVGGFFVIAAVGWFVTYAARVGWLSETSRVVLGYCFSITAIVFGAIRADRERTQGNMFLVIGSGAMLISTLAGIYYNLIIHGVGLFVMLTTVACITLISFKQKNPALTSSVIFFGAIIPLFFFASVSINTIFVYLFILTLGTIWIVSCTQWRGLTFFMLSVVAFYSLGYLIDAYRDDLETVTNIVMAFLFVATFYAANISAVIKSSKPHAIDLVTAMGTGLLFLIWMLSFAPDSLEVFLLLIGTMFFAVASYVIFERTGYTSPTVIYSGVSAMLFAVATALQFDGPILVTAYAVEAAAVAIVVMYFMRATMSHGIQIFLIMLYGIPLLMSLYYVGVLLYDMPYQSVHVMEKMPALFALFIVCITAFAVAIATLRLINVRDGEGMIFFRIFAYVGGVYALLLVWFVAHIFMRDYDVATFVSLVIYTVFGVFFYIMGMRETYRPFMFVGGLLFGIVVLRVLLVEFWEMDIVMRIITSFVLGSLLISTAFIRPSKK